MIFPTWWRSRGRLWYADTQTRILKDPADKSGSVRRHSRDPVIIELRVTELSQIFNSFDPSPFRGRDLNTDAADYVVDWAKEIPRGEPVAFRVHLDRSTGVDEVEILSVAVREYFGSRSDSTRLRLRQLLRVGHISLIIGLVFLAACILLSDLAGEIFRGWRFAVLLQESLLIGGWVAMWRPLEIFLYDWWPILTEARLYDRLSNMPVEIVSAKLRN